jgi:hypothetical protein
MSKVISSHNLSIHDNTLCEIDKYLFALKKLDEIPDDDKVQDLSQWSALLSDVVSLLDQHVSDLHTLDTCIRKESDCN